MGNRCRNQDEIVFGDHMGSMEYRFSFRLCSERSRVEGATAVKFVWRRSGRSYRWLVQPTIRQTRVDDYNKQLNRLAPQLAFKSA